MPAVTDILTLAAISTAGRLDTVHGFSSDVPFSYRYLRSPISVSLFWIFLSSRSPTTPQFERFYVLPLDVTRQRDGARLSTEYN